MDASNQADAAGVIVKALDNEEVVDFPAPPHGTSSGASTKVNEAREDVFLEPSAPVQCKASTSRSGIIEPPLSANAASRRSEFLGTMQPAQLEYLVPPAKPPDSSKGRATMASCAWFREVKGISLEFFGSNTHCVQLDNTFLHNATRNTLRGSHNHLAMAVLVGFVCKFSLKDFSTSPAGMQVERHTVGMRSLTTCQLLLLKLGVMLVHYLQLVRYRCPFSMTCCCRCICFPMERQKCRYWY